MLAGFTWGICRKLIKCIWVKLSWGFWWVLFVRFLCLVFFFPLWLIFNMHYKNRLAWFSLFILQGPLPFCNLDSVSRQKVWESDPLFLFFPLFSPAWVSSVRPSSSPTCQWGFCAYSFRALFIPSSVQRRVTRRCSCWVISFYIFPTHVDLRSIRSHLLFLNRSQSKWAQWHGELSGIKMVWDPASHRCLCHSPAEHLSHGAWSGHGWGLVPALLQRLDGAGISRSLLNWLISAAQSRAVISAKTGGGWSRISAERVWTHTHVKLSCLLPLETKSLF